MTRPDLLAAIACPDNLRAAFLQAARGKSATPPVREFRAGLAVNIAALREELLSGAVRVGDYHFFRIHDPKERRICAASFRERVLHHAVMRVCEPCFERYAVHHSYACRRGKGLHRALERAQSLARRHPWYLKLDIHHYFDSIHHQTLLALLAHRLPDPKTLELFARIIGSYHTEPGCGLPIGNLISQHCANLYLGLLDHALLEERRVAGYLRYMDDFLVFAPERESLRAELRWIEEFLARRLRLILHPRQQVNRCALGIPFLGFRVFPDVIRLTPRSRACFARKLRQYEQEADQGRLSEAALVRRVTALVACTQAAEAAGFRRAIFRGQDQNWPGVPWGQA